MVTMGVCPACGATVSPDEPQCPECGTRIEGSTAAFEAVATTAEDAYGIELGVSEVPVLVVQKGAEVGERFYLEAPDITIGRDPSSDIFLNDVTVSRAHARLYVAGGDVRVVDAGSLNGTFVNGELVNEAALASGDTLQIGRFRMVFLSGGGA
jgi:pSer/pThr/pTyr-binding forkhead associated (FHA) protein